MNPKHPNQQHGDVTADRPDAPAVPAAAAGKTTREHSGANQTPHEPSQPRNCGPPFDDDDESVERLASDVLLGAKSIAEHITALGFPVDETDVYYLHRTKKWPFNKYGVFLIASKNRLNRHAKEILCGPTAASSTACTHSKQFRP